MVPPEGCDSTARRTGLEEGTVGHRRRMIGTLVAVGALALATVGVGAALAQSDGDTPTGSSPTELLERLDALEDDLPEQLPPAGVELDQEATWGELQGDATSVRAVLDTLEPDLRQLFIDADDADGDVADGVALVARGWLDVWTGTTSIAAAEGADLAFPIGTTDAQGVATGADEFRGEIEIGLELLLSAHDRLLAGYVLLEEVGEAELDAQLRIDERANQARAYDAELRPLVVTMLSQPSTSVLVPVERFVTDAPGVDSRAGSLSVVCVDRAAVEELGGVVTPEVLAELEEVDRVDCTDLPGIAQD